MYFIYLFIFCVIIIFLTSNKTYYFKIKNLICVFSLQMHTILISIIINLKFTIQFIFEHYIKHKYILKNILESLGYRRPVTYIY